jgi:hypothetical protein
MLNVTKDDFPLLTNVNENYLQVSAPGRFRVLKKNVGSVGGGESGVSRNLSPVIGRGVAFQGETPLNY